MKHGSKKKLFCTTFLLLLILNCSLSKQGNTSQEKSIELNQPLYKENLLKLNLITYKQETANTMREIPANEWYIITGDIVNIRAKPNKFSRLILKKKLGQEIYVTNIIVQPYKYYFNRNASDDFVWLETSIENEKVYVSYNYATPIKHCAKIFNGQICYQAKVRSLYKLSEYQDIVYLKETVSQSLGDISESGFYSTLKGDDYESGGLKYSEYNFEFIYAGIFLNKNVIIYSCKIYGAEGGVYWNLEYLNFIVIEDNVIVYKGFIVLSKITKNELQDSTNNELFYDRFHSDLNSNFQKDFLEFIFEYDEGIYNFKTEKYYQKKLKKKFYKITKWSEIKNFHNELEKFK
ncbi:MAG: hypothetical protein SFU98_06230 [Leptospiraceae bacterium]|nr:hypothetical protein [Leptospiraceae bacterium]